MRLALILPILLLSTFSAFAETDVWIEDTGTVADRTTGLMWVADAAHVVSTGLSDRPWLTRREAFEFLRELNQGRIENFGRNDWRLASEAELAQLYQDVTTGVAPRAAFKNFEVFANWYESRSRVGWNVRGPGRAGTTLYPWPVRPHVVLPPGFANAVLVATNSIEIERGVTVTGNVVVNEPGVPPTLGAADLELARDATVNGNVRADSMLLNNNATVNGIVFVNDLEDRGANINQLEPYTSPVFDPLPPCRQAEDRPDAEDVVVAAGASTTLSPGVYGDVTVGNGGELGLEEGEYSFRSVAVGQNGLLTYEGPVDVRIVNRFDLGKNGFVGPAAGSTAEPSDSIIYANGPNGGDGTPGALPAAWNAGRDSVVQIAGYACVGTVLLDSGSSAIGTFLGRDIRVDGGTSLDPFFVNLPPIADPQSVNTFGANSIEITLTGSDPEFASLSFSIDTQPTKGTLSNLTEIVPAPVPNPDPPPAFVQPPTVSATVTYTPNDPGAEEEDSFVFAVTDDTGQMGMATVTINPPEDTVNQPPPPIAAFDQEASTLPGQSLGITLTGNGDDATYSIVSLPTGTLVDSMGNTIGSVPYALPAQSSTVTYTPAAGAMNGDTDSFMWELTDGVDTDGATVTISIGELPELAPDQQRVTAVNTPIEVTLVGNSGGSGQSMQSQTLLKVAAGKPGFDPAYGIPPPVPQAETAGNVSDANGDGIGDGRDNLPGPAPVLVAAGVDVNLNSITGSVSDPAGDATNSTSDDPANPDLVSASVSRSGSNLNLSIRFVQSGFSSATSRGSFVLDIDENPATGFPGIDAANNDSALMGVEFLVNIGANLGASADVLKFVSLPNNFTNVGNFPATVLADGYDVSIPLSVFDNDDGRMTFKGETQSFLGSGFTGILDYAPDVGLAPGQSTGGVVGVARVQIEWDIPSLGFTSSDQVLVATVQLQTEKGTVDSLDTFWYAGTGDQDGVLDVSDFEAPAGVLSGVVMPVPRSAPTGQQGTFSFDVTNAFKAALDDPGIDTFSVQARVDESRAGGGFLRGLQVRSTADSNVAMDTAPRLSVTGVQGGDEPAPAPLVWTVTELPVNGTLTDSAGLLVTSGQTFFSQPTLLYTPDTGFEGNDSISYMVAQSGLLDTGLVTLVVTSVGDCTTDEAFCDDGRP